MDNEHLKSSVEIFTRQHEFYAARVADTLQFPIKLILSLNSTIIGAFLLLTKIANEKNVYAENLAFIKWGSVAYGIGLFFVFVAMFFQWRLPRSHAPAWECIRILKNGQKPLHNNRPRTNYVPLPSGCSIGKKPTKATEPSTI